MVIPSICLINVRMNSSNEVLAAVATSIATFIQTTETEKQF